MKRLLVTCAWVMLMALAPLTKAAEKYDPAALAKTIEPYMDEATLFVAHLDMTQLDLSPAVARVKQLFPRIGTPQQQAASMAEFDQGVAAAQKWIGDFAKAGGRDCFAVLSMSGFPDFPVLIVVPVQKGADTDAILKLLGSPEKSDASARGQVRGNVILWARKATLDRLATLKAPARPELAKAFEAAGDSAAQGLYVPSADTRRVLSEMLPGGGEGPLAGAGGAVANQILWTALGMNLKPQVSFTVVMQSPDAAAATSLSQTINNGIALGKQMLTREIQKAPEAAQLIGDVDALARAFTPAVEGDRLILHLDTDQSLKLTGIILPAMAKAREQAQRVRSLSNLRQVLLACIIYANDHNNEFPPDLQTVLKNGVLKPEVLRNPRSPDKEMGYAYLRPSAKGAPAEQVVAWEAFDQPPPTLAVAFADGHAEIMTQAQFQRALAESKARNGDK